ncbi:MAG: hypothetical protein M4579_003312 [Chaenotheca gracillima]|nr:MAG: hypothetical protein M4579_003312 [Chaenotheca gracillima]
MNRNSKGEYAMGSVSRDVNGTFADGIPPAESKDRDENDLAAFGKRQQLKRKFGFVSMVGLTCTLMATWEGLFSVFSLGLTNGGPAGLVYSFIICWIGTTGLFASMAEMASAVPLAGGQYSMVSEYSPESCSKFLSYITGWLACLGWQAATASSAYLGGTMIQGLIVLNNPSYVPQRWQGTLLFYAILFVSLFFNTYLVKHLPKIEGLILIIHVAGFFGVLIPLVYMAPRGSASDVFTTFTNGGGWSTQALSFFVGLVTGVYSFLAEEIENASTVVPRVMVATTLLNGVLGFGALMAILFCAGNIEQAENSPTGYPFIEIFYQATRSYGGATAMTCVILALVFFATIGLIATASRMTWAFARDNALPGSYWLAKVEPRSALPLYSIGVTVGISVLLALINIGSSEAFNAIVSLSVMSVLASYCIPIICLLRRRFYKQYIRWGPWRLGRWGALANIVGVVYALVAFVFSFWPADAKVNKDNMNWACLVWGTAMLFCGFWYVVRARKYYHGPVREFEI